VSRDLANRVTANKLCPSLSIRLHKDRQHRHRQENCNREQQGSEQAQENFDESDAREHIGNLFRKRSFAQSEKNESALVSRLLTGGRFFEKQETRNSLIFERISFCSINIG
jgi:hypothetical protein